MRLRSRLKDWLRCRALRRRGIATELTVSTCAAGTRSGVWVVHPDAIDEHSVVYSFGVGDNIAWDLAMIERFGVTVHAFDPTPESQRWLATQGLPERFSFHPVGLADRDGDLAFCAPAKPGRPNYVCDHDGARFPQRRVVQAPVKRLTTVMAELGHRRIDVLKMDIEGGEYAAIEDLVASAVPVAQLLVEFHHNMDTIPLARTEQALDRLRDAGFRIFHISDRGLEFSLLRSPAPELDSAP